MIGLFVSGLILLLANELNDPGTFAESANFIKSYSFYLLFNPYIFDSSNLNAILKNVIPKENISLNSGLNSPLPKPFIIFNNSGDI